MANATQIEQLRKKRQKRRIIRNLVILSVVMILVVTAVLLWHNQKVQDELRGYADELAGNEKSFPRSLPVGDLAGLYDMDNNCVVLTESNLAVYANNGAQIIDTPHNLTKARVSSAKERLAIYSRGGKEITIRLKDVELYKKSFDYPITTAVLSNNYKLAVATGSKTGGSLLTVLTPELEELYRFSSVSGFISDMDFSLDEKMIAVSTVSAENGGLVSAVTLFDFQKEQPQGRFSLKDQLILSTVFKKDRIELISEKSAVTLNEKGEETASYPYADKQLYHYSNEGDYTVLVLGGFQDNLDLVLTVLDKSKRPVKEIALTESVKQLAVQDRTIYLLCDQKILCYDMEGVLKEEIALPKPMQQIVVTKNSTIYAADTANIYRIDH